MNATTRVDPSFLFARETLASMDCVKALHLAKRLLANPINPSVDDGINWTRWVIHSGAGMILFAHRDPSDHRGWGEPHDPKMMDCAVLFLYEWEPQDIDDSQSRMSSLFGDQYANPNHDSWRWKIVTRLPEDKLVLAGSADIRSWEERTVRGSCVNG